ncbi:MAG: hypothetical protein ACRDFC_01270 [Ignavibacteria bacterium]
MIADRQFKSDKEIEEELQVVQVSRTQKTWRFVIDETPETNSPGIIIDDNEIIGTLMNKIRQLEEEINLLKKREETYRIQSLIEQNEASRKEIEEIFELDPDKTVDTKTLDGMLSEYITPTENADEMVSSVRDNS